MTPPVPASAASGPDRKGDWHQPAPVVPPLWLSGPGGISPSKEQAAWLQQRYESGAFSTNSPGLLAPEPAWQFSTQAQPLAQPAWLAARGEGSIQFRGFISNTDVFDLIREQF